MADLNTMYQNGMGNLASINMGRQVAMDQRAKQLENDQAAVMNPLNAQFRQGQIAEQAAQLPGIQGQSASLASQGQVDSVTTGAKIAQRLSSLSGQIGVDGMQKMGREGEIALQASQALSQYPPALHKQVLSQIMQTYGSDANSPMVQGIMKLPDGQVQKALASMGTGMAMASQKYIQESALEKQKTDSSELIGSRNNSTSIEVAKINAASREAAARARAAMLKNMNMDQQIAALSGVVASGEATDAEVKQYQDLKKQRLQERAAGANALPATVMNQATPLENAAAAAGSAPAQTAPTGGDVGSQVTAAGLQYEPDKYEYALINGAWKRRPKR